VQFRSSPGGLPEVVSKPGGTDPDTGALPGVVKRVVFPLIHRPGIQILKALNPLIVRSFEERMCAERGRIGPNSSLGSGSPSYIGKYLEK